MKSLIGILLVLFIAGSSLIWYGSTQAKSVLVNMDLIECYTNKETYKCDLNNNGKVYTENYSRQGWKTMASYPVGTTFEVPVRTNIDGTINLGIFLLMMAGLWSIHISSVYQTEQELIDERKKSLEKKLV